VREQDTAEPGHAGPEGEGLDPEREYCLARDGGDDLIVADGAEHAPERRATDALERQVDQRHCSHHQGEVEEVVVRGESRVERARDRGHAVGAAREPGFVQQEQPQHLGEPERDDGEVVLAETQRDRRQPGPGH